MFSFAGVVGQRIHIVQFKVGDLLLEGINEMIRQEKIENAVILAGLGTLDRCRMHYVSTIGFPAQDTMQEWKDEPIGVASMNGIIANGKPHIHMVISTYSGDSKAFTGHLELGCRVLYRVEMSILEVDGLRLERELNERGIEELHLRR